MPTPLSAPEMDLKPSPPAAEPRTKSAAPAWLGKKVGRFKLLGLLGRGAYGRVFLAEDTDLHRRVALKVVTADAAAKAVRKGSDSHEVGDTSAADFGREAVDQMVREARAAARLEHPGVVTIYEVGKLPGTDGRGAGGFIAMELAEGGTLQELVNATGPMDCRRACTLVADAADALQFAHALGVIHRDVKPANLMLTRTGRCKVADFGLAYIDDPGDSHRYARIVGTAAYVAPEVILGNPADSKSDQYSLGATLFALLAARPPYVGTREEVLAAHINEPPPNLEPLRPDLDPALGSVIRRAMAKNPDKRFDSIGQLGKAMRLFTVGDSSSAGPFVPVQPLRAALEAADSGLIPSGSAVSPAALASMIDLADDQRNQRRKHRWLNVALAGTALAAVAAIAVSATLLLDNDDAPPVPSAAVQQHASTDRSDAAASLPPMPEVDQARLAADLDDLGAEEAGDGQSQPEHALQATRDVEPEARARPSETASGRSAPRAETRPDTEAETESEDRDTTIQGAEAAPLSPLDVDRLLTIARGNDPAYADSVVSIDGTVSYARTSRTGKVFRVYFEGSDPDTASLRLVWFPHDFDAMEATFGGTNGSGLFRKKVRVTGRVEEFQGDPQIVIEDPSQIEVLE